MNALQNTLVRQSESNTRRPPEVDKDSVSSALKTFDGRNVSTPPPSTSTVGRENTLFPLDSRSCQQPAPKEEAGALYHPRYQGTATSPLQPDPEAAASVSNDARRQKLRTELLELADIPNSQYQRRYPQVSTCDTIMMCGPLYSTLGQYKKMVQDILHQYRLLDNQIFQSYLASKKLKTIIFSPSCFMWNNPIILLEIIVHFIFSDDPALRNISFCGKHGYALSFRDDEILKVIEPIKTDLIEGIEVSYTKNNKPIIQQQATRGCTYAVAAMLIHQHNLKFSPSALRSTNLGNNGTIIKALSTAGLLPFEPYAQTLEDLALSIDRNGSAIVTVDDDSGGHAVIVDEVAASFVLIRDPYHGWEVEVSRQAFRKYWVAGAIQVKEKS